MKLAAISCLALATVAGCGNKTTTCSSQSKLGQAKDKVDILFMVDDSPSMTPKQAALQERFPDLIKQLDDLGMTHPVDYHIGVVTSDMGAGQTASVCTPGGLGAKLQPLGKAHGTGCVPPTGGVNYLDYNQLNGTNNLPAGVDISTEFTCMASVGDTGCGFEHQLESAYRALHDCLPGGSCTIRENAGFLRPDSLLVVILVTDEDDCSADPTTDLFDLNKTNAYRAEASYRCTNYGIECVQSGTLSLMPYADSGGALMGCQSAPNPNGNLVGLPPAGEGKLVDLSRYINFFTQPTSAGGVRANQTDLILAAFDAPSAPVASVLSNPETGQPCASLGSTCEVTLQHSCDSSPTFFGDPAVRINQVLAAAPNHVVSSICEQDYSGGFAAIGAQIATQVAGGGASTGGTTGSATGSTGSTGGSSGSSGGSSGGSTTGGSSNCTSGKTDNVAACNAFVQKVKCGTADISMYVDCSAYANTPCDISDYFTCLQQKFVCTNGMYDPSAEATIGDCSTKATCP